MPVQKNSIVNNSAPALEFSKNNQTWTILEHVMVAAASGPAAVYSTYNGSTLINKGHIASQNNYGVFIDADKDGAVINEKTGTITGIFGVQVGHNSALSKNMVVENHGDIIPFFPYGVEFMNVSNGFLKNTGVIDADVFAAYLHKSVASLPKGSKLVNSGKLKGDTFGVFSELGDVKLTIVNKSNGLIKGGSSILSTNKLKVTNKGELKGDVQAVGGDNDKVVNKGKIKGDVRLGTGDDTYKNTGDTKGMVYSGFGNDTLQAGNKEDKFVFDTTLDASNNVDRVKEFESGEDMFYLDIGVFTALAVGLLSGSAFQKGSANDAGDRIIYKKGSGRLLYDEDGDGPTPEIEFARVDAGQKLNAGDFTAFL